MEVTIDDIEVVGVYPPEERAFSANWIEPEYAHEIRLKCGMQRANYKICYLTIEEAKERFLREMKGLYGR